MAARRTACGGSVDRVVPGMHGHGGNGAAAAAHAMRCCIAAVDEEKWFASGEEGHRLC